MVLTLYFLYQLHAGRTTHKDGRDDAGKQHHIARCQYGDVAIDLHVKQGFDVAVVVGNHLKGVILISIHLLFQIGLQNYSFYTILTNVWLNFLIFIMLI